MKYVLWLNEIRIEDIPRVGGKSASLGEMYQTLTPRGVTIPNGFAVTAEAYFYFIEATGIRAEIQAIMAGLDVSDVSELEQRGAKVRRLILAQELPADLSTEILDSYARLSQEFGLDIVDVAVRSSATAEDLPDASFAGQQETFLNVNGKLNVLLACKQCMASLFTNRAIAYRELHGFDHFKVGLSVCVQKMVRSDLASSGVIFTLDTESGFLDVVFVTASWGLGENIVQGNVNPDTYYVFKPKLATHAPIVTRGLGSKQFRMVYGEEGTKNLRTARQDRLRFCLTDEEVLTLAKWAVEIEAHYTQKRHGALTPMDIEWAKDGQTGRLFVVQARPETVHSRADRNKLRTYSRKSPKAPVTTLAVGQSVGSAIASGAARVIHDVKRIGEFQRGDVLVTEMTDPDWAPIMKTAAGIVTNRGGRTCHAAIISRELGVPCVVGCGNATDVIDMGAVVTVDCSSGEVGYVLEGAVPFKVDEQDLSAIPRTKTKVMVILGNPDLAFKQSFLPTQGVGLMRMEFVVSNHIKVHPMALLHPERLSKEELSKVNTVVSEAGYSTGKDFFVSRLAEGVATVCAAFYPHDVILRFSDFKSNEYANLLGGRGFEELEDNPMLGFRGASRYYDPRYEEAFLLECEAALRVRETFGLDNLVLMIPFLRTVDEAKNVLATMAKCGLRRGQDGLRVYAMCEIPSNVILAEEFLQHLDGFSIGSNDLTQLILGVDRDSQLVSRVFDERNAAVKAMIAQAIAVCRRLGKYIGICGQGPSDHPDFCDWLVEQGIESISVTSDRIISTIVQVAKKEGEMKVEPA